MHTTIFLYLLSLMFWKKDINYMDYLVCQGVIPGAEYKPAHLFQHKIKGLNYHKAWHWCKTRITSSSLSIPP